MGCINSKSEQFGSHHSQQTFAQLYTLKDELGRGAFSVVRSAIDNNTQKTVAVKIINKKKISPDEEQSLRQEIAILQAVNHPHVVSLFDVFDEKHSINLVLERIGKSMYQNMYMRNRMCILF